MNPVYIADYNYPLPDERIAKYPLAERDRSKLLVYKPSAISGQPSEISEDKFYNVGKLYRSTKPYLFSMPDYSYSL